MTREFLPVQHSFYHRAVAVFAAIVLVGVSSLAVAQNRRASTVTDNRDLSALAVAWLQGVYGGETEVSLSTSSGVRRVDLLTQGVANEVKVGNHSLTGGIRDQIRKDRELLSEGRVRSVAWHFMSNPTHDDEQYISEPLVRELYAAGFSVHFHGEWYTPPPPEATPSRSPRRSSSHSSSGSRSRGESSRSSDSGCCRVCRTGQACGNSCISRSYTCRQPPGCACDG